MKIVCITDQHFMYKKSSKIYFDYQMRFYKHVLFPYLKANNITSIIDLGDTTDNRKFLELDGIHSMKREYYDKLTEYDIHMIVGNHQVFYKDSNHISTPELILKEYKNIKIYSEATTIAIGGRLIDLIPWINNSNFDSTKDFIDKSKSQVMLGHLEANGAMMYPGHVCTHGTDPIIFQKYRKVLSGHLHFRHRFENIHYIGNTGELNRGDEGAIRGFAVLDTDDLSIEYVNNPYKLFKTIYYNDDLNDYNNMDLSMYKDTFTKLIVESRSDICMYDVLISKLYEITHELKIIERSVVEELHYSDNIDAESKDTISLFEEYLNEMQLDNVNDIKTIIRGIYNEAAQ